MSSIQFDGEDILDVSGGIIPRYIKHESAPDRTLQTLPLAREDGEVLIYEKYGKKVIKMAGILQAASQDDLEDLIDTFKELTSRPEKTLSVDWAGGTLEYIATCSSFVVDRDHFHLNFAPFTLEFTVLSGEGKDENTTTAADADGTTGTRLIFQNDGDPDDGAGQFTLEGGSKAPKPSIRLHNISVGSAVRGVEYKNTDTGEKIIATYDGSWGDWSSLAELTIDCDKKTVIGVIAGVAGKALRIYGTFPKWIIGQNNVQVSLGALVNQKSADESAADVSGTLMVIQSTNDYKAQSFMVPMRDGTFNGITLYGSKEGTPGNITWRIEDDNGGKPSGTLAADENGSAQSDATGSIGHSAFGTSAGYVTIGQGVGGSGTKCFKLFPGRVYWLVLKGAATLNSSNRYFLSTPNLSTYPRGRLRYSTDGGSTWTDFTTKLDLVFRILMGGKRVNSAVNHTVTYKKTYL